MTITKNQYLIGGLTIGAILIFGVVKYKKRQASLIATVTPPAVKPATVTATTTTPTATVQTVRTGGYSASGNGAEMSEDEKAYELYKSMIGMAQYIQISTDANALRIRTQVETKMRNGHIDKQTAIMKVLIGMNKGKEGLQKAVALIGGDLKGHVEYFNKNDKFKI